MNSHFSTAVCRALMALVCMLAVAVAPVAAGFQCRATGVPAMCKCCTGDQPRCCATEEQQSKSALPVAPTPPSGHRDLALVPVAVIAVLPPVTACDFPKAFAGAGVRLPRVSLHSFLCIRTV